MTYEEIRQALLAKPEAFEDYPFGPDTAVFKINSGSGKKMFATLGEHQGRISCNLKCDPDEALALRDIFPGVIPGYHMNKKHWNTVFQDGTVPDSELLLMIDKSYALVVQSLTRKERLALELAYGADTLYP